MPFLFKDRRRFEMPITRLTALEIFSQARDLQIAVSGELPKHGGKRAFGITRGPGHNFKPLLSSQPVFDGLEPAVDAIRSALEDILEAATAVLADSSSLAAGIMNPDNRPEEEMEGVLTPGLIERICEELRKTQVASTFQMEEG